MPNDVLPARRAGDPNDAALVLLHGFPFDSSIWRETADALADQGHYLISPDLPGHGQAGRPAAAASIDAMAASVFETLDHLHIERFAVAGHSLGGYVALAMLAGQPARIRGLALISSRARADSEAEKAGRDAMRSRVASDGMEPLVEAMLPKLVSEATRRARPEVEARLNRVMLRNRPAGASAVLQALRDRSDRTSLLGQIRIPTLVAWGQEDTIILPTESASVAAAIPNAMVAPLDGVAHCPMLEAPGRLHAAMLGLLRAL